MADNLTITQGSGTTIAADDISGVLHQRVKISQGADGSATDVSSSSPLNVTLANTGANATPIVVDLGANNDVTVTGTVAVSTINSVAPAFGSGVRGATVQRVTVATDDVVPVTDNSGSLTVDAPVGTPVYVRLSDGAAAITTLPVSMATNTPLGTVAHDGVDSGAPIKVGGRARSSEITAVASDDRSDFITDLVGKQIILPYANPENFVSGAITSSMTSTTSTSLVSAPGAGLRNYITTIIVSNAHATQGTDVVIQDGSGGTTLLTIPAAAVYGGAVINLPVPLRQPTTNTAIYCANVTTGASTKVSAVGYKGA